VARDAGEDALQLPVRLAGLDRAAALVGEGDHAVNVGEVPPEVGAAEAVGDVCETDAEQLTLEMTAT
jgi:hypothetical protein